MHMYTSLESMCVHHFYNLFRMYILDTSESDFSIYHYICFCFFKFYSLCILPAMCVLYAL